MDTNARPWLYQPDLGVHKGFDFRNMSAFESFLRQYVDTEYPIKYSE